MGSRTTATPQSRRRGHHLSGQTTSTPSVFFPAVTRTGWSAAHVPSAPLTENIGLRPVSRYTPAGNESTNLPLLPTVTVNLHVPSAPLTENIGLRPVSRY